MAELDGRRIAAVFAADTAMNVAAGCVSHFDSHIHKFAYAGGVKTCERIGLENLVLIVRRQEFACVVAAETEGHLRKVVGTEAEKFGFFCDFVSGKCRARDFDHGTDFVFKVAACCFDESVGGFDDGLLAESKFLDFANQRNHDFGNNVPIGMTVLYRDYKKQLDKFLNGVKIRIDKQENICRIYNENNEFIGIGTIEKNFLKRDIIL